uniref:Uncharacterized protein n=2 Tax=Odontella aurita TaxID=265563 RepID=A0A7S4HQW9_9STRA|mmetsp:Transcript_13669/g.39937  ORF Transcript_13669/g.39937 Transcript_13669/m.39937 type:complete len:657 (+) Transcript_13669:212-2182(+)
MSAPVHVLMLPSSAASSANCEEAQPEIASFKRENAGDYLDRRCQILKGQRKGSTTDGTGRDAKDVVTFEQIWSGSSPLEVAIATCCDHEGEDSIVPAMGRETKDTESSSTTVESGSSDMSAESERNCDGEKSKNKCSDVYRCGAIGRGKEGKFAALIARHCHSAGDRALSLAVLQRTMERDEIISKQQRGKKRKRNETESPSKSSSPTSMVIIKSDEPSDIAGNSTLAKAENASSVNSDEKEIDCHRMNNFLSAGGLKVLNQWLIDAFTPVTKAAEPVIQSKRRKPAKDQEVTVGTMTSPTGPILLPIIIILQSIPFNMELVMDSQINKQIKKLKKSLDRLVANFDEEESESSSSDEDDDGGKVKRQKRTLEALTHPVSGGMPVVQVQKDVEKLMQTWKVAASDRSEKDETLASGSFYGELRAKMEEQFLVLSRFESGEAEKPAWLEKLDPSPATLQSPPQPTPATNSSAAQKAAAAAKKRQEQLKRQSDASKRLQQQQAELKAAQAARLEAREKMEQYRKRMMQREGTMLKKRKAETVTDSQDGLVDKKPAPTRKVTWADQKIVGAKLVEVREFVRETDVYQSEEEEKRMQDSDDDSDEKFEEDDFDDETQASDSADSDDFDGIMNEEEANFSQEEEAGVTFETLHLRSNMADRV